MKTVLQAAILFTLLASIAMPVVSKPVYKWLDERGVVNYTTEPPPITGNAKPIVTVASKINSFDPVVAGLDASSQQRRNREYLRHRVDQLQNELMSLRSARQGQIDAAEEARRRRMEECQRQRRVDCDTYFDNGFGPRFVIGVRPVVITGFVQARAQPPARVRALRLAILH